jgi:hypothetical protein
MASARARRIIAPESSSKKPVTLVDGQPDQSLDIESPAHRKALARFTERGRLISTADQVAGDTLFFMRYRWPEANRHYPDDVDAMMRFVSRYYPHADGGPLYLDEPKNLREVNRCEEKRKIMKKLRLRYCVIAREYYTPDGLVVKPTLLSEALEQLET